MMTSSSSSSSSASVTVEKATSDLLIGPDWTINIEICDSINSKHWDGKDIIKTLKKRLQHKSPKVQLLALTLLETLVKNCGDYVHFQIVEKNILQEMIKITKKKTDMHVRDKILVLLDSWQEAFGGPGGKYPQYYWAYEELRRSGVVFPRRSPDSVPIFTPPVAKSSQRHTQPGYGMPSNSSSRLDQAMAADVGNLSLFSIDSMRYALDLLAEMLRAVNPSDRSSVKDEIIVDLVNQCRSNQKKLMQTLATTGDEELLSQGLDLNDNLQNIIAKHDAIASGSPLPSEATSFGSPPSVEQLEMKNEILISSPAASAPPVAANGGAHVEEEEENEEEDDFALLARRHNKTKSTASEGTSSGTAESAASVNPNTCTALALPDPPAPIRISKKDQDMEDILSLALTTLSPQTPPTPTPPSSSTSTPQVPFNDYVAPWAQQPQTQTQSQNYPHSAPQLQTYPQNQIQSQTQNYPHSPSQLQKYPQAQMQYSQNSYGYPPPPWAPTPGYLSNPTPPTFRATPPEAKPIQQYNSFPVRANNGSSLNGEAFMSNSSPKSAQTISGSKPFIPSYRLFEDLNVLGNNGGSSSNSLSGASSGSGMVGGRK